MEVKPYGYWDVLKTYQNVKVKELSVEPGKHLSMQKHKHRSELWFVAKGTATVNSINIKSDIESQDIPQFGHAWIKQDEWHQLENRGSTTLKIVEIQWGDKCEEDDIERKP